MNGFMQREAPRVMPPLSSLLADLGDPSPADLGRFLGLHPRTVARWIARDCAPRAALLALFWLTRWGRSQIACSAVNDATLLATRLRAQVAELEAARAALAAVLSVADFGAANSPTMRA